MPDYTPRHTWGGPGNGSRCPVCGNTLSPDDMAFELEFATPADTPPINCQLHVRCLKAWEAERESLRNSLDTPNLPDSEADRKPGVSG
jgi:hypothetical protein